MRNYEASLACGSDHGKVNPKIPLAIKSRAEIRFANEARISASSSDGDFLTTMSNRQHITDAGDEIESARPKPRHQTRRLACVFNSLRCALSTLAQSRLAVPLRQLFNSSVIDPHETRGLAPHLALGARGERLAAERLRREGYRLVAANFKLNVGRNLRGAIVQAEIDIVAYEGATLCFVEVKTRASDWHAAPEANVDLRKQRQVARAARAYRRLLGLSGAAFRYDVVSVILPPPGADGVAPPPRVTLLRNFWTDAKFRKRRWRDVATDG